MKNKSGGGGGDWREGNGAGGFYGKKERKSFLLVRKVLPFTRRWEKNDVSSQRKNFR